jgi:multiple sugar transport system substrate-binding protein
MLFPEKKLLFITLAIVILALTACASQPTPEPVTITFTHFPHESDYIAELIPQFNETHPEITIELKEVYGNNLGSQTGVDVYAVDLFSFLEYQPQGLFLDLSPLVEQDQSLNVDDFFPGAVDVFTLNAKIWAIPTGIDPFIMYYNRELFDQYGVDYPTNSWSWDDLQTIGMLINDPDNNVYGFAVPEPYFDMIGMVLIHQHGGQLFDDLYNPTALTYNRPENIAALEWYSNLYHLHGVIPTPQQARAAYGGSGVQTLFRGILTQKIAIWPGNYSDRGGVTWPVEWDFDYGMVVLPTDEVSATSGFGYGYAIAAASQNPEAAWKWINYLSKQVPQIAMPARISLSSSEAFAEQVGSDNAAAVLASAENLALITPDLLQFEESFQYFHQALVEIVNGTLSAEDALNWAQDMAD